MPWVIDSQVEVHCRGTKSRLHAEDRGGEVVFWSLAVPGLGRLIATWTDLLTSRPHLTEAWEAAAGPGEGLHRELD